MERDRLKALFWPFKGGGPRGYYQSFEQRAQSLDSSAIESELSAPTYRHQLRDMLIRGAVGMSIVYGISKLIQPTPEPTLLHWAYLFSLSPQYLVVCLQSATRSIIIQNEQKILQKQLARRQKSD